MTRRSTRLMRSENSLYRYDKKKGSWAIKGINQINSKGTNNLFELGSYFTCKHMSQKVNPISFRISNNTTWNSTWFSDYKYFGLTTGKLQLDIYIREYIRSVFKQLKILVDKIYVKEINDNYLIRVFIIDKVIELRKKVLINSKRLSRYQKQSNDILKIIPIKPIKFTKFRKPTNPINPFYIDNKRKFNQKWFIDPKKVIAYIEIQLNKYFNKSIYLSLVYKTDIGDSASLLGNYLITELEKPKMNFKKALRYSLNNITDAKKIRGLRINCSGRLGRAPRAKMEWFRVGSIPLSKISAKVDYTQLIGKTKYGIFGIKVWLYKY
jgi:ribosomal protein S3